MEHRDLIAELTQGMTTETEWTLWVWETYEWAARRKETAKKEAKRRRQIRHVKSSQWKKHGW